MEHIPEFIMNHYQLTAAFSVVLLLLLFNEWKEKLSNANSILPSEVVTLINRQNAIVFDIRTKEKFNEGHIISSKHTPEIINDHIKKHKTKNIIIVCDNGSKSHAFSTALKKEGFDKVSSLEGGVQAWRAADLPIEKSSTKKKKG